MQYPNENIVFQEGLFTLKWENEDYTIFGELVLNWLPSIQIVFKGKLDENTKIIDFKTFSSSLLIELSCTELNFYSKGVLRKTRKNNNEIECLLVSPVKIGNVNEPVENIRFELTNQEQRCGDIVQVNESSAFYNRLELKDDKYKIILDQYADFLKLKSELQQCGGYQFLSSGKIDVENGESFRLNDVESTLAKLSAFLQFLNARKCPPLIVYGFSSDKIVWKYIQVRESDSDEYYNGWVLKNENMKLHEIWNKFCEIWSDKNDKDSLQLILHWYNEANKKKISIEGRIVLIQNALELMFNWLIFEKFEYVTVTDANNMSASAKIGFLLSFFQIDSKISDDLLELKKYAEEYNYINSSETFVSIRNSLVHSTLKKRKRLETLSEQAKKEALNLGVWFVEVLLLKLLGHNGFYQNRCKQLKNYDAKDKI